MKTVEEFKYRDAPSGWRQFTSPKLCEGCRALCCTFPVEASIKDLHRLGLVSDDELMASPKKIARQLVKEGFIKSFRASTGIFTLSQKTDESCVFLGADRRCTVYTKRPEVCRLFPKIGPRPGYCPQKAAVKQAQKSRLS